MVARHGQGDGMILFLRTSAISAGPKLSPKRKFRSAAVRLQWSASSRPWKGVCRQESPSIPASMAGLRSACAGCSSWLVSSRQARPIDPLSELAKALEAYPSKPIDDDGDDDGNEPLPSEAKVDPDPAASSADMPTGIIPKNRPE
jgi:hypothetical protein